MATELHPSATALGPQRLWPAAIAGLCALLLGIGLSRFGYTPLIPALIQAHWFDTAQTGYLGATNLAGYLIGAALARRMTDHLSPTKLIAGAMALGTASFFACAFPLGFAWYFVWRATSGIIGGFLMVLAPPLILAATPPERRGRIGGIVFTGVGLGIALSGTLVPLLLHFGLPQAWFGFAALAVLLTALTWSGMPRSSAARSAAPAIRLPRAPLNSRIVLLLLAYSCNAVGFVPHTVFWVDYIARGLGQGIAIGGFYWILLGLAGAAGPVLLGLLADRIGFRLSFRLSLFGMGAAVGLPLLSTHPLALALSSIGVGALAVGGTSLASGRVSELVPIAHQRQVWGWTTIAFSILYAGAGYALAFLRAWTGSYQPLFAVGATVLVLGGLLDLIGSRD